jgi:alpha-ketoglutarate-dependent taurine dioxygenase
MSLSEQRPPGIGEFKTRQRKVVRLSQENLVRSGFLDEERQWPMLIEPEMEGVDLVGWALAHRDLIDSRLLEHGGILFRGFDLGGQEHFQRFAGEVFGDLLDYKERAAPRVEVSKGVYTSTEFPPDQWIPLHHEMSYSHNWPSRILFYCDQPAPDRGRTPIVRASRIRELLDPRLVERFAEKKVMYVRNYGEGVDMSWQDAFQTRDRAVVEEYCRKAEMTVEWRDGDRLRTRTVRPALIAHPRTGETIWFNHAHMFHHSNLPAEVREALLEQFREDELPRNAFYGDGSSIESSLLEEIRETYLRESLLFPWQKGDVLVLDNFLVAHGREPFSGPRRILVALSGLHVPEL